MFKFRDETLLTNFSNVNRYKYEAFVDIVNNIYDMCLYITDNAYDHMGHLLEDYYSLHTNGYDDLTDTWVIHNIISKLSEYELKDTYIEIFKNSVISVKDFYINNDNAHQIDHAFKVLDNLLDINNILKETDNISVLIIAAVYHDIYSNKKDRAKHHVLAAEYILIDRYIDSVLSIEDKLLVSIMIREHRASFKGKRDNILCEMMAAADVGLLTLRDMIQRSRKYNDGDINRVIKHLKEKFGHGGYYKPSELYLKIYGKGISSVKDEIEDLHTGKTDIQRYL